MLIRSHGQSAHSLIAPGNHQHLWVEFSGRSVGRARAAATVISIQWTLGGPLQGLRCSSSSTRRLSIPVMVCGDLLFSPWIIRCRGASAHYDLPMLSLLTIQDEDDDQDQAMEQTDDDMVSMAWDGINRLIYQCPRYSKCSAIHLRSTRLVHNSPLFLLLRPLLVRQLRKVNLLRVKLAS